jgi:hypothetical protein
MKHLRILLPVVLALAVLCSCTKKSAQAPSEHRHATVVMRDGTSVPGSIVSSSPTEVTIAGDDKIHAHHPDGSGEVHRVRRGAQAQPPAQEQPQASPQASGRRELTPSMPGPVKPSAAVTGRAAEPPARSMRSRRGARSPSGPTRPSIPPKLPRDRASTRRFPRMFRMQAAPW